MKKIYGIIISILILLWIYHQIFFFSPLSSGDWDFNFPNEILGFHLYPFIWNPRSFTGMGGNVSIILGLDTWYFFSSKLLFSIGLKWEIIERVVWLLPILGIQIIASWILSKDTGFKLIITTLIISTNTYILMVIGGGQFGVAMGYSLALLVYSLTIKPFHTWKISLTLCLLLGLEFVIDPRIFYISTVILIVTLLGKIVIGNFDKRVLIIQQLFVPVLGAILINSFQILPAIFTSSQTLSSLGNVFVSNEAVKFFSFAQIQETISLLHPNWPQNIFGKTYFMRYEFLIIPIIAYTSLLFLKKDALNKNRILITASFIGIIGTFLAKGSNPPFGEFYIWLFNNIPGFIMFRDSSKWYIAIVMAYSVLIPSTVTFLQSLISGQQKRKMMVSMAIICVLIWGFLIKEAVVWKLSGTFTPHTISQDYKELESIISSEADYFRTAWFPAVHRYGVSDISHPGISLRDHFNEYNAETLGKILNTATASALLSELSVKYIIIPDDTHSEFFIKDEIYSQDEYIKAVSYFQNNSYVDEVRKIGKIHVFKTKNYLSKFRLENGKSVSYVEYNPTKYELILESVSKGDKIIFSEQYDKNWEMHLNSNNVSSSIYKDKLNSFKVPRSGTYSVFILYSSQSMVNRGLIISIVTIIIISGLLLYFYIRTKKNGN